MTDDTVIIIDDKCVIIPYRVYEAMKAFHMRAEDKLAQLEKEASEAGPGCSPDRGAECKAMIETLRWLLSKGFKEITCEAQSSG